MGKDSAGRRFRELMALKETGEAIIMPGVFNAITAKLASQAGFAAAYLSGAGVTNALTGYPDVGLLSQTEMAQQARYVTAAIDIPVIADADTGYGEALNTARTVQEFEHAGVAGIHLEDQLSPKRCGHLDGKRVISATDMEKKIRAANNARSDRDFLLIARTDSRTEHGLQDAIDRAKRYLDGGADAIFPESLQSMREFEQFSAALCNVPLMANMTEFGKTPLISAAEFAAMGYSMVIFPMSAFRVMMKAGEQAYAELFASGTQAALLDKMQTRAELYDLIEYDRFDRMDKAAADTNS